MRVDTWPLCADAARKPRFVPPADSYSSRAGRWGDFLSASQGRRVPHSRCAPAFAEKSDERPIHAYGVKWCVNA